MMERERDSESLIEVFLAAEALEHLRQGQITNRQQFAAQQSIQSLGLWARRPLEEVQSTRWRPQRSLVGPHHVQVALPLQLAPGATKLLLLA